MSPADGRLVSEFESQDRARREVLGGALVSAERKDRLRQVVPGEHLVLPMSDLSTETRRDPIPLQRRPEAALDAVVLAQIADDPGLAAPVAQSTMQLDASDLECAS